MDVIPAVVSAVEDDKKFVIRFTVEGLIDNMIAYPIDVTDEPQIGDPILVLRLETIFGYCFMYNKMRLNDVTRLKLKNAEIDITEDAVIISAENKEKGSSSTVVVNKEGDVEINCSSDIVISSNNKIELSAPIVKCEGRVIPDGQGPFCAIDVCPVTGLPTRGSMVINDSLSK